MVDGVKLKAGMAFKNRADRKTYVVTSVRSDSTVIFAVELALTNNTSGDRWDKSTIKRVSNDEFIANFRKFVESAVEAEGRIRAERHAASFRFEKMSEDFAEALKMDVLMDAKFGNMGAAMEKLKALLAESKLDGRIAYADDHYCGYDVGYDG